MAVFSCCIGTQPRPVIILGPFAEALIQKLVSESPDKYSVYNGDQLHMNTQEAERAIEEGVFVDYKKVNDLFLVYRTETIHKIASQVYLKHYKPITLLLIYDSIYFVVSFCLHCPFSAKANFSF